MDLTRKRYTFTGRCQGVGFRWNSRMVAQELGLTGWVRNLSSGDVVMEIQGSPERIERFLKRLFANYERLRISFHIVHELDLTPQADETGFEVHY